MDKVFHPGPNRIFVFGSNRAGRHGAGAAQTAYRLYGAIWGLGEGLQGTSYAIPTKSYDLVSLTLREVKEGVDRFLAFAAVHLELTFFVTRIGCGLAGYLDCEIGPMFFSAPDNCELPDGWGQPLS